MSATIQSSVICARTSSGSRAQTHSTLTFAPSLKRSVKASVHSTRNTQQRGLSLRVCAEATEKAQNVAERESVAEPVPQPTVVAAAQSMGYNTSEGLFGFTPFGELWTGRLAMSGFTIGLVTEFLTGKGILAQVGLNDGYANPGLFTVLAALMGGASLVATTKTCTDMLTGNMPKAQMLRYAKGFGLTKDQTANLDDAADSLKDEAPSASVDGEEVLACDLDQTVVERTTGGAATPGYAEYVEISNGRWAMIGFATAILIEAASGNGIIPQLIGYGKASGLLGVDSGF